MDQSITRSEGPMTHALIIGGTRGIGAVIAQTLAERGDTVKATGRGPDGYCDNLANSTDKLTYLVFCQRYRRDDKIATGEFLEHDAWQGEISVSLNYTHSLIELHKDRFDGDPTNSIVILSSIIAHTVAEEQPVGYHVAKSGLESMARDYAVELGPKGIRVNCVAPSVTLKPENKEYYDAHPEKVDLLSRIRPLRRMGTAQDVANVVKFLCSPDASFVTGQTITVDGGVSLINQEALARSFLPKERE